VATVTCEELVEKSYVFAAKLLAGFLDGCPGRESL
jgi:hypothetical protein